MRPLTALAILMLIVAPAVVQAGGWQAGPCDYYLPRHGPDECADFRLPPACWWPDRTWLPPRHLAVEIRGPLVWEDEVTLQDMQITTIQVTLWEGDSLGDETWQLRFSRHNDATWGLTESESGYCYGWSEVILAWATLNALNTGSARPFQVYNPDLDPGYPGLLMFAEWDRGSGWAATYQLWLPLLGLQREPAFAGAGSEGG